MQTGSNYSSILASVDYSCIWAFIRDDSGLGQVIPLACHRVVFLYYLKVVTSICFVSLGVIDYVVGFGFACVWPPIFGQSLPFF